MSWVLEGALMIDLIVWMHLILIYDWVHVSFFVTAGFKG